MPPLFLYIANHFWMFLVQKIIVSKISQKNQDFLTPSAHLGLCHKKKQFFSPSIMQLILMFVMAFFKGCTKCSTGVVASIFSSSTPVTICYVKKCYVTTQGLSHALIPSSNPSRSHSRGIPIHLDWEIRLYGKSCWIQVILYATSAVMLW